MKRIRIGVIGLGVGERHIAGYNAIDGVEVTRICDIDPARLNAVGDRWNIDARHADYRDLLAASDLDAVSICSHDDHHVDQAVAAFAAGCHVMVEKPVALHASDLERLVRAQQDAGRLITSNLILRQSPRFIELQQDVARGVYGDVHYIEGDYLHQILWKITEGWRGKMPFYCVTYGGGIHLIDLMRWIIGEEVREVAAMAAKKLTRGTAFAYPDTMVSLLRFDSDALGKSTTSFGTRRPIMHTLNLYGTQGSFENAVPHARRFTGDRMEDLEPVETPYPAIEKGDLLPDFIAAIREGRAPKVGAQDVYRAMDICFACWESAQSGRTVPVTYTI